MNHFRQILQQIWHTYSGEAAWQTVADLSRFHRIQASPGHRQAAQLLQQRLVRDGLNTEILSFPADEQTAFWTWSSFQEWDCTEATLHLVTPEEKAQALADFRSCPISLIQRSVPFEGEVEVVLLEAERGDEEAAYDGLDVAGKVVLSRGDLRRVWELAVARRGAVGILFDGMRAIEPVRPEGDLVDARQYTSFWWQPADVTCFGFVLTPRQGQMLRRLLRETEEPVRIHARVKSRLYDGALEVVQATIPGKTADEIIVVAHLCHPQPSANDNASGAAAAMEAARTLQTLIAKGELPSPQRTIRFLWLPEMTGTVAYLSGREGELDRLVAGINLDMVGEDQDQTGSSWLVECPPDAAASFAPDLLAWLRDELLELKGVPDVSPSHTGIGGYPLYRQAEAPFSGGSDHLILSDPTVGVPTPMLIQWPDRFYHTTFDTPDRTDPHSLARSGTLAAGYAYWLATASTEETAWLGYEMVARYKACLTKATRSFVTGALGPPDRPRRQQLDDGEALARALAGLDRRLAYLQDRQQAALSTLERLAPVECLVAYLKAEAKRATERELDWAKGFADLQAATLGLETLPVLEPPVLSAEDQQAAGLVPARQMPGPIPLRDHLRRLSEEDRAAWHELVKARKDGEHHTLTTLALYWADGTRSVLDIAHLVELETGKRDLKLLLTYFQVLEKLDFISFQ
jgi:aminopeptidase YwaD